MQKEGHSRQELDIYLDNLVCIVQEDFLVLDEAMVVVDASPSFFETFDLDATETRNEVIYDINEGHWDSPKLRELLEDHLQQHDMVYDYVMHHQFDERGERVIHINGCRFGYVKGLGQTYILTLRDTTANYREKEQLREDLSDLEDKNDALDAFAHTVAHDLKNPVSSMMGFASIIREYYDRLSKDDILENIEAIMDSGYHIQEIIDSTLTLAMLDRSDKVELEPIAMHPIIETVQTTLDKALRESNARIQYPDSWHLALGYNAWIENIWMNYISNAIKYGGKPPVIKLGSTELSDKRVLFWIKDNGDGIPPDKQEQVFQSFTRINPNGVEGHGLGLAVVQKIMNKLGGETYLESTVGEGSTFGFILPSV